jgi:hypothetical protein
MGRIGLDSGPRILPYNWFFGTGLFPREGCPPTGPRVECGSSPSRNRNRRSPLIRNGSEGSVCHSRPHFYRSSRLRPSHPTRQSSPSRMCSGWGEALPYCDSNSAPACVFEAYISTGGSGDNDGKSKRRAEQQTLAKHGYPPRRCETVNTCSTSSSRGLN